MPDGADEFEVGDGDPDAPPIDGEGKGRALREAVEAVEAAAEEASRRRASDVAVDPIGAPSTTGYITTAEPVPTDSSVVKAADALAAGIEAHLGTLLVHQRRQLVDLLMAFYKARAGLA